MLQDGCNVVVYVCQASAQQWFHDNGRDVTLRQFAIQVFGIDVALMFFLGMTPIDIVELDLYHVPSISAFVMKLEQIVEYLHISVERETQVADASFLALFQQMVEHAIVQEASFELFHTSHTDAMQKHVVDVVHLQFLERVFVHLQGFFATPLVLLQVRNLGCNVPLVTRMAIQGNTGHTLAITVAIHRSRIEIVHTMLNGIIHQSVYTFLVYFACFLVDHTEPTQASVSQQRYLIAGSRSGAVGHAPFLLLGRGFGSRCRSRCLVGSTSGKRGDTNHRSSCIELLQEGTSVNRIMRFSFFIHRWKFLFCSCDKDSIFPLGFPYEMRKSLFTHLRIVCKPFVGEIFQRFG